MLPNAHSTLSDLRLRNDLRVPTWKELDVSLRDLVARHPGKAALEIPGRSRSGKPVICARIGLGPKVVAVTGGAHADEPVGSLTCLELASLLVDDVRFEETLRSYTFLIHPMLDPDGAERNESWSTKPYDYRQFLLHGCRNVLPSEDMEHGVPVSEGQDIRPEMTTFLRNMAGTKDRLVRYVTLHSTHRLGGALFVVTRDDFPSELRGELVALCAANGIPVTRLDTRGEDGVFFLEKGFLRAPRVSDFLARFADRPEVLSQIKMSTYEHAEARLGATTSVISELPCVVDARLDAMDAGTRPLLDHKRAMHEAKKKSVPLWTEVVDSLSEAGLSEENLWLRQARFILSSRAALGAFDGLKDSPAFEGKFAFLAEDVDATEAPLLEELEAAKYLYNGLPARERYDRSRQESLVRFSEAYRALFDDVELKPVPLETQVRVQIGMILAGLS